MDTTEALGRIVLQHSALIDRDHNLLAVRLGWTPLTGCDDVAVPGMAGLLPALGDELLSGPVALLLPARHLGDLQALQAHGLQGGNWVEFPADLVAMPQAADALAGLKAAGVRLLARGRPPPAAAQADLCIDASGLRRVHEGVATLEQLELAVAGGVAATLGWPVQGAIGRAGPREAEASLQLLIDIIQRIDQGHDLGRLGALIESSPTLAFRLLALLNSAACGFCSEVTSVRHAIMLLGYPKLRQWLSLLVATAVETPRTRPLMQASLRRAFLMQELAQCLGIGNDRGDMFICGMFSLLDRMMGRPMAELLGRVPLSDEVAQCLAQERGPLKPYLDLARQVESVLPYDLAMGCEATATTPTEVNLAVLRSLAKAASVGGVTGAG